MTSHASTTRRSPRRHLGACVVALCQSGAINVQPTNRNVHREVASRDDAAGQGDLRGSRKGEGVDRDLRWRAHQLGRRARKDAQPAGRDARQHATQAVQADEVARGVVNSPGGGAHNSGSRSVVAHLSRSARVETRANGPCAERDSTSVRVVPAIRGNQFHADRLTFVGLKNETDPACRGCSQGSAAHPGGRRLISPAFRSEYRATGSVRLSGDSFRCTYSRMKSLQNVADAGSIPAASTTTGVHGFDGTRSVDGRLAMVPAVSGSAESGVRCDGPNSQTPMTAFIGLRRQPDVPAARNGTKGRHLFNAAAAGKVDPRTKAAA